MEAVETKGREPTALQEALRKTRTGFVAVAMFSFFLNLLMLATPLYMMQVFQRVLSSGHLPTLFYLTVVTVFALFILGTLSAIRSWVLGRISGWLSGALSGRLIATSVSKSLTGDNTGAQPLRELGQVRSFIGGGGITAMFDSPWVPVFIAIIWLMHPWLGTLALASAVMLFALALLNEVATRDPEREASQQQSKAYEFAETSVRNAEVVHAMGMLPALVARWNELQQGALDRQGSASSWTASILGVSKFVRLSVQVGILGLGATLVLSGELTPGAMIAASILLGRALAPVEQSISAWRTFVVARASYGRLQNLLQTTPEQAPSIALPTPAGRIEVENLTFKPKTAARPLLQRISFVLEPGETLAIVGASAAGKSTLCRMLVGVYPPTLGSVRLDAAEVHAWNREEFGRHVGYLPQGVELFTGTVRENIARMGECEDSDVIAAAKLADVHEIVLRLPDGYDTQIGEGGALLSAGQRQRLGLARALLRRPRVVVLDEPNANLDRFGETALLRALNTLKQNGTTVVIVAHHASMLQSVDKLLVMRDGKMDAFGARNDVITHLDSSNRAAQAKQA
jgi:ATP-binding cassette subfamily C protein/ATP-binding cassette subfamily C exporter for protease/lipase/ATP-binding cassette subfamily C protein EexD